MFKEIDHTFYIKDIYIGEVNSSTTQGTFRFSNFRYCMTRRSQCVITLELFLFAVDLVVIVFYERVIMDRPDGVFVRDVNRCRSLIIGGWAFVLAMYVDVLLNDQ